MEPSAVDAPRAKQVLLRENHGYRIDGDTAALHADLAIVDPAAAASRAWALQLWACDAPYSGGALRGTKVAEAPIALTPSPGQRVAEGFAEPPTGRRAFAMVMVLASGQPGHFDELHDFANYPAPQRFEVPCFEGALRLEAAHDGGLVLHVGSVLNPRASDNLSGSLRVECWIGARTGGAPGEGEPLAVVELGRLAGGSALPVLAVQLRGVPRDTTLTVLLREWTSHGYVTRDEAFPALPALAAEQPHVPAREASASATTPQVSAEAPRVSLARASAAELAALPGLTAKLAAAIIRARPFESVDALTRVRGIGPKMLDKLRSRLTVD